MSIEPISSAMSYQAQQTQMAKQLVKPEVVDTEVAAQESTTNFDPTTARIVEAQEADTRGQRQDQEQGSAEGRTASNEQIRKAVEQLNKKIGNSEAVFGIHEGTNRVTIKLIDKETKKTIKELPPEETLDMIAKVWEMAGILVDEKR